MTAMTPMTDDDPIMIAWKAYRATDEAMNSEFWAKHVTIDNPRDGKATVNHLHFEGAMWAVFLAGYTAAQAQQ